MNTTAIKTDSGAFTIYHNGKGHSISTDHANYDRIEQALISGSFDELDELFDVPSMIAREFGNGIEIDEHGQVHYNGSPMHNALTRRIMQYCQEGIEFDSLIKFFKNLMKNPSKRAVDELYSFLDNQEMPVTIDGCFVGYKAVTHDWKDKQTGTIDNSIGAIVSMPRNEVDDDPTNTCSKGLHIANHRYATGFMGTGDRLIAVEVNPVDCVCVPNDYNAEKLRACKYTVLAEVEVKFENQAMYQQPVIEDDEEDLYEDDDDFFGWD